jgi:hypothetical protein
MNTDNTDLKKSADSYMSVLLRSVTSEPTFKSDSEGGSRQRKQRSWEGGSR